LFNTALTTRRLEAAYEALAERYHAGLPPQPIALENGSSR
jgi:hypothetical protein